MLFTIRIQALVLFSCAVLLRQNHGFSLAPSTSHPHHGRRAPSTRLSTTTATQQTPFWKSPLTISDRSRQGGNKETTRMFADNVSTQQEPTIISRLSLLPLGGAAVATAGLWTQFQTKRSRFSTLHLPTVLSTVSVLPFLIVATTLLALLPSSMPTSVARQSMTWYLTRLDAFPLVTKSVTSGIIGVVGDFCAQSLEHRLKRSQRRRQDDGANAYDARRGMAILLDGMFVSGPIMHWGYDWFERIIPTTGGGNLAAMIHVVADSLVLDSLFVATAIIGTGLLEGFKFRNDILPQLKRDYAPTLKAGWATSVTLMPLQFVCFRFLPVTLRTIAMNLTDVIWNGIISFMAHRSRQKSGCEGECSNGVKLASNFHMLFGNLYTIILSLLVPLLLLVVSMIHLLCLSCCGYRYVYMYSYYYLTWKTSQSLPVASCGASQGQITRKKPGRFVPCC